VTLTLTVLGSAGSHTQPGRLCSGYLLQADGTSVLIDAGNGSTANLQRFVSFEELDAVTVSHRHIDHCVDLIGGFYALYFGPGRDDRLPLHAPAETIEMLRDLLSSDGDNVFDEVYEPHEVSGGDRARFGSIEMDYFDSVHPPQSVSVRAYSGDQVMAYSGDSAGGEQLIACARNADLFLCEASWAGEDPRRPEGTHLTGRQAGTVARQAGVGRLLLTHVAGATDRETVLAEAREEFDGPIELAEDLASYTLG
jgi:ribonuclease BN (tRNA processing enzyme)